MFGEGLLFIDILEFVGYVFEFWINVEDFGCGFLFSFGCVDCLCILGGLGVCWDSGIEEGDVV